MRMRRYKRSIYVTEQDPLLAQPTTRAGQNSKPANDADAATELSLLTYPTLHLLKVL